MAIGNHAWLLLPLEAEHLEENPEEGSLHGLHTAACHSSSAGDGHGVAPHPFGRHNGLIPVVRGAGARGRQAEGTLRVREKNVDRRQSVDPSIVVRVWPHDPHKQ